MPNAVYPIINNYDPYHSDTPAPRFLLEDQPCYGDFAFQKVDDQTTAKALNGAEFTLWRKSQTNGSCLVENIPDNVETLTATSGEKDFLGNVVSVDGKVVFKGISIGKAAKDQTTEAQLNAITGEFCLRETKAPAGCASGCQ